MWEFPKIGYENHLQFEMHQFLSFVVKHQLGEEEGLCETDKSHLKKM